MECVALLCIVFRFWGTPIPIWISEDGQEIRVIGSIEELEEATGTKVKEACKRAYNQLGMGYFHSNMFGLGSLWFLLLKIVHV
jgi:isoleucyl-tRNA synthetase